jgi:hypothetical protein
MKYYASVLSFVLLVVLLCGTLAHAADQVVLTWTDLSNNEQGFNIFRKAEACALSTLTFTKLASVGPNIITYTDTAVTQGVTYCYEVDAYNTAGESAFSNTASKLIPFTIPVAPSGLTAQ